jgi:putative aldouronate transport system permease protein
VPALNPARVSALIDKNASLFTCAVSYSAIANNFVRAVERGWITRGALVAAYVGALIAMLAVAGAAAAFCMSMGNNKLRRLCALCSAAAGLAGLAGAGVLLAASRAFAAVPDPARIEPLSPVGIPTYFAAFALLPLLAAAAWFSLPRPAKGEKCALAPSRRLFLMLLPFLVLVTLFSYLPLWGWRVSFFDYRPGFDLTKDNFVGLAWFRYLFDNPATRARIGAVLRNTFAMSGIGIATSWLPMVFAIFLSEMRSRRAKRWIQTVTTVPNFISWVLVYSVAFAIFSTEGFLNWALGGLGLIESGANWLMSGSNIWLKMWAWGTWKGLGWGAIIYIAAISGIDPQLYEAATVDGAGRFARMWHVTVPGLLSTYFVLLLLGISNILSNGMDQYLVFSNPANKSSIEVLDLYVYNLGLASGSGGNIPLATLIGMLKSIVSVTLLLGANRASKLLRGESIV